MVRADERPAGGRPVLTPDDAAAEKPHHHQPRQDAKNVVDDSLGEGAVHSLKNGIHSVPAMESSPISGTE
jgi:hypothetical protein